MTKTDTVQSVNRCIADAGEERSKVAVDFAAVGDHDHGDSDDLIFDVINDPVVTGTDASVIILLGRNFIKEIPWKH